MQLMRTTLLACVLFASNAFAQNAPNLRDLMSARSLGMGGAFRALGLSGDAVIGNPAAMSAFRRYQIEVSGGWDIGNHSAFGSGTVVDSQTSTLAAGLDYHFVHLDKEQNGRNANFGTLALALPLANALHLGVSAHYLFMPSSPSVKALTGDAGLIVKLGPVQIGASGHQLFGNHPELPRYFAFAAGYSSGPLSAEADVRAEFDRKPKAAYLVSGGMEYLFASSTPLRLGYAYDSADGGQYLSTGTGLFSGGNGIDVAYRHQVNGPSRYLVFTLRMQP